MKKLLIGAEYLFTVVTLLIYSGAILDLVLSGGAQENQSLDFDSSLIRIIYFFLYIATLFLLVLRWKKTLYILSKSYCFSILVIFASISIIWSFESATTLKNSFTLIGSSLFAVYLSSRYTLKEQCSLFIFSVYLKRAIIFTRMDIWNCYIFKFCVCYSLT